MAEVLLVDDALFELHASGSNHPERPARLVAARAGVAKAGVKTRALEAIDADRATLEKVHSRRMLDALDRMRGERGMIDADTYVSPRSIEAAVRAAGGVAELARALVAKEATRGVALVRPPGHHAEPERPMGFCLVNNVAVGVEAARAAGAKKIAVVDVDVHHGNGTQACFWRDPEVLYVSTHQWPFYPGTGSVDEIGEGAGAGATVNVPLSEGANDDVFDEAMERIVGPVVRQFAPDLLLVSAGFDAFARDPLAMMEVSAEGYASMIGALVEAAGNAPVGLVLEGGYDLAGLEACVQGSTRALLDPPKRRDRKDIDGRHRVDVERAVRAASAHWLVG